MKLLLASSSIVSKTLIQELSADGNHLFLGVITNPDKPAGRGQAIAANELAAWCHSSQIKVHKPTNAVELEKVLTELEPEIVVTVAYGRLVPKNLLNVPKFGWINIHFSMLPKYRGAAPVQWAILRSEKNTGVTIFKLDQGMDTGPVYIQQEVSIDDDVLTNDLLSELSDIGCQLLQQTLILVENGVIPTPQLDSASSLAPKFSTQSGRINWSLGVKEIYNLYRALGDNPGIWCQIGDQRLKIHQLALLGQKHILNKGELSLVNEKLIVGCGDGSIEIVKVTPAGRKQMSGVEFFRGITMKSGISLG